MDYSTKERLINASWITAVLLLAAALLIAWLSGRSSDAAMLKAGKELQVALASYEAERGHYPKQLDWQNIERVLTDENDNPYLVVSTAEYTLNYRYCPAGDDIGIGYDSYEAYLLRPVCDNYWVVRITPEKVEATTIKSAPSN